MEINFLKSLVRVAGIVLTMQFILACGGGDSDTVMKLDEDVKTPPKDFKTLNYSAFSSVRLGFGGGLSQTKISSFDLNPDNTNVKEIKMYVRLDCPSGGCNIWDVYANIKVKDKETQQWYEIGRYITPYGVDTSQLQRGIEIDVTDFKSILQGRTELRAFIEVWGADGWNLSVDFDYIEGVPDFPYYAVSEVFAYNNLSLAGVPYGTNNTAGFDLTKTITIPKNAMRTHLRTIISGWGHATPADSDGRGCAEWCFRTHNILINDENAFIHEMKPIGCGSNPVNPQRGNWAPDRAGWCPGMAVPLRIDKFKKSNSNTTLNFEYDFEDWISDGGTQSAQTGAFYAISTYVVVKSNTKIEKPLITN